mmetsp:Transcript_23055/g.72257  ORF Transcript_23055/g.72257 Transcript_23055/m.72257 type:complete len:227 (-) Transcript_23055:3246-3926(-)
MPERRLLWELVRLGGAGDGEGSRSRGCSICETSCFSSREPLVWLLWLRWLVLKNSRPESRLLWELVLFGGALHTVASDWSSSTSSSLFACSSRSWFMFGNFSWKAASEAIAWFCFLRATTMFRSSSSISRLMTSASASSTMPDSRNLCSVERWASRTRSATILDLTILLRLGEMSSSCSEARSTWCADSRRTVSSSARSGSQPSPKVASTNWRWAFPCATLNARRT